MYELKNKYRNDPLIRVDLIIITAADERREATFEPAVLWVYCTDVDNCYATLKSNGVNIVENIDDKPWGTRQFTVHDLDINVFYFHHS